MPETTPFQLAVMVAIWLFSVGAIVQGAMARLPPKVYLALIFVVAAFMIEGTARVSLNDGDLLAVDESRLLRLLRGSTSQVELLDCAGNR